MCKMAEKSENRVTIINGLYYWVKCFTDDKYEPTIAIDNYYRDGVMYFKFLNDGIFVECTKVFDYKELNFHQDNQQLFTLGQVKDIAKHVMDLGMGLRQSQLNGYCDKSGNDVLDEYFKNLKPIQNDII